MCESTPTPLARLSEQCAHCLRHQHQGARNPASTAEASCEPCRELAFRALCNGNDAAWDLLLVHLWPFILRWLYAAQPELTPTRAEALGYQSLRGFRRLCAQRADLATNFPSFPLLLTTLQFCLRQVVEGDG